METYYQTFDSTHHKYTLNLPKETFKKIKAKARSVGIYRVSIYLRALIDADLKMDNFLSQSDIIFGRKESLRIASADHRREKLKYLYSPWYAKISKKVLDKIQSKQLYFQWIKK